MITMIFLTTEASAISGYCTLPGGSDWLVVIPGAVGGCWAAVADAGDWCLGCGCGGCQEQAQRFVTAHAAVYNLFKLGRHLV
jgi:hypothetical protein